MTEQLNKVPDAILQEPTIIEVDIKPCNWLHKLLQKLKILPKKRKYAIAPQCTGSLIKISKVLLSINFDASVLKSGIGDYFQAGFKHMAEDGEKMARIIAYAIVNRKSDPPRKLIDLILDNFTSAELASTVSIVLAKMEVKSFMNSIILVRGMNLLKMSPDDQGS